ncbi:tail morphogenetic protein F [Staphylococcus phage Twort]|uniref:ORF005 n=2 Tax=Staphylococcus phage Twort (strain DSM 17442 / HER 48) TaxID=2908167 RepID=Q4Z9C9_BPTWO|nr:virion structural protein [Staphylococcus phage Twort]AAX92301.1 ORF005 [Staphylococcus phage Twort]QIW89120.1 tail morphogenetic protein F [Staphylococcus phage Twort]
MSTFLKNLHPLLKRQKDKRDNQDPNYALIKVLNEEMNQIEQDAIKSKLQSSLKTATGAYLNKFGDWFGVYRKSNESDDIYRDRIIEYVLLKRGTNNSIVKAIKDYLEKEDAYVSVYEPYKNIFYTNKSHLNGDDHLMGYYYRFAVINIKIGSYFPTEILDIVNKFKPAGVKVYLTYEGWYTNTGGYVTKMLEGLPKITNYTLLDRLSGFGDTFYGHLNLSERKESFDNSTSLFNVNRSKTNSKDVLSGSSSSGRTFYNYAYYSTHEYTLEDNSSVTSRDMYSAKEMPLEYYAYSKELDNYIVSYTLPKTQSVKFIHNNFNLEEYFLKYNPEIVTGDKKKNFVDFIGEARYDYYISALVPPEENIIVDLQIFDFVTKTWNTIKTTKVGSKEVNVGGSIGYLTDYINSRMVIFTRLRIREYKEVDIKVNYIDISFSNTQKDKYTNNRFLPNIYRVLSSSSSYDYVDLTKISLPTNGDIISKRAYYPSQFIRIGDEYSNSINRNLLNNTIIPKGTYTSESSSIITKQDNELKIETGENQTKTDVKLSSNFVLTSGSTYTLSFMYKSDDNTKPLDYSFLQDTSGKKVPVVFDSINQTSSYTKVIKTFTLDGSSDNYSLIIGKNSTDTFYIKEFKLERGSNATPFQPNPSDLYSVDPNNSVTIDLFKEDNTPIESVVHREKSKNLLQSYKGSIDIHSSITNTEMFTTSGFAHTLYSAKYLSSILEEGKKYTIHFELEIIDTVDSSFKTFSDSHGIWLYSATTPKDNINMQENIIRTSPRKLVKTVTFTAPKITDHRLLVYSGRYTTDGTAYTQPVKHNTIKITNFILQEEKTYSGYSKSSYDEITFLDKTVKVNGARTDIGKINVNSIDNLPKARLLYSTYGSSYDVIKNISLTQGTNTILNKYIDLYGLNTIDYSDINPMSDIVLQSIWDIPINKITSKTGKLDGLYKGFFNAGWQHLVNNNEEVYTFDTLTVLKDTEGGVFDNSTGDIVKMTTTPVTRLTSISTYSYSNYTYQEPLLLDSSIPLSDSTRTLNTESYEKDVSFLKIL